MSRLLRKDRPWIGGLAVAGGVAIGIAMLNESREDLFTIVPNRLEAVFHVAWIAGLVLGIVAATFDDLLGTREFLVQRPIARSSLLGKRLVGMAVVLFVWLVVAPTCAWLVTCFFERELVPFRGAAIATLLATSVVAVSAAATSFAAMSLPLPWWQRVAAGGAWFVAAFGVVHAIARGEVGNIAMGTYVVGHLVVTIVALAIARVVSRHDADADLPLPAPARRVGGAAVVVALAMLAPALLFEMQGEAIRGYENALPRVARRNDAFTLYRPDRSSTQRHVVDGEHRPTGETFEQTDSDDVWWGRQWSWYGRSFSIEEPRFGNEGKRVYREAASIVLTPGGAVFLRENGSWPRATGRGAERGAFAPGSDIEVVGDTVVVADAATLQPWRFDPQTRVFVRIELPAGDRLESIERVTLTQSERDREARSQLAPTNRDDKVRTPFLRGKNGAYTLRGGEPVLVPGLLESRNWNRDGGSVQVIEESDPLVYTVELPRDGTPVTFRHEFRPRTAIEWFHAGTAMVQSLLRPPVLQVTGNFVPMSRRVSWFFDRLTIDGRRPWLVFAGCLLAGLGAFRFGRRLHALGADRATVRWWCAAILLCGPVALFVGLAVERPRRHARRAIPGPAPAPRILTAPAARSFA